ncbi:MAG: hypothetical protein ACFLMY_13310 [Candidatus Brachytrichaceae bacterium NZ_4S206]
MSSVTLELTEQQVIELARSLSTDAKRILLKELIQEFQLIGEYPTLSDEDFVAIAESLFLELDKEEALNG